MTVKPVVYVGAPWKRKLTARAMTDVLLEEGFHVISSWINQPDNATAAAVHAQQDYFELCCADIFLQLNLARSAGKATEFGIALAKGLHCIVVRATDPEGDRNVFYHLPQVVHVASVPKAIEAMWAWAEAQTTPRTPETR